MKAGMIIVNKEKGYTSQDVVSCCKKILNIKKVGHIGTLDPLATGVLPILFGNATKLSKYFMEHDKTYVAELKLGVQRDTGDEEGNIVKECEVSSISEEDVKRALCSFVGKQKQAPHKFSAIKVNGKKLYEYARKDEDVEIPLRDIEIYEIELLEYDEKNKKITFVVKCSKGTYIRVLCEDIAKKLGTVGYMKNLKRIAVDRFCIENAVSLGDMSEKDIICVEDLCKCYSEIVLDNRKLELFLNGVKLTVDKTDGVYRVYNLGNFIGLGVVKDRLLKRDIVIL